MRSGVGSCGDIRYDVDMKVRLGILVSALGISLAVAMPSQASADIVERTLGEGGAFYVLQGSRSMRDLGERRRVVVSEPTSPPREVRAVSPALETGPLREEGQRVRPRFGFGSDWTPDGGGRREGEAGPVGVPSAGDGVAFEPRAVYRFRYHYPVHRDYIVGFPRYYPWARSPCPWSFSSGFGGFHGGLSIRFSFP